MRKRFNRLAICSSDNYKESKKLHKNMLEERHSSFSLITFSASTSIAAPIKVRRFKTIKVFGKDIKVSLEEYNEHCKSLGL